MALGCSSGSEFECTHQCGRGAETDQGEVDRKCEEAAPPQEAAASANRAVPPNQRQGSGEHPYMTAKEAKEDGAPTRSSRLYQHQGL